MATAQPCPRMRDIDSLVPFGGGAPWARRPSVRRGMAGVLLVSLGLGLSAASLLAAPPAKPVSDLTIRTEPVHAMVPAGGKCEFRVILQDREGKPLAGELSVRLDPKTSTAPPSTLKLDGGSGSYCFQAAAGMEPGVHIVSFQGPQRSALNLFVDVVDQATYDQFGQLAQKVRFERLPAHLLFIGDSLSDQLRGQNYVDKVAFWLGGRFGRQFGVRNAGVGGDYITRVWDRLNHEPKINRPEMYEQLYTPRPTHVFFFLGHNDSKLKSESNYTQAVVLPDAFEATYRQTLQKVKQETQARLVVLSATSSVYEITKATADKRREAGKAHNLFGKPEALEQFNTLARKVAQECGADYVDVYEPTRRHVEKPSLFTADGVHLSNLGNRLIAWEVLKYLAGQGAPR